jgi:hypothetical protein
MPALIIRENLEKLWIIGLQWELILQGCINISADGHTS